MIEPECSVYACHWINPQHLAVCESYGYHDNVVKVFEVTPTSNHLAYTIKSPELERANIHGVAVSESLPGSMLVICNKRPYVYQFPCHEATQTVKRYKIQSHRKTPLTIVANASVAVIRMDSQSSLIVCSLPDFTHQSHVPNMHLICDLSISSDYLLVLDEMQKKIGVRSLSGDMSEDVCEIEVPDGCKKFRCVCFGDAAAREIYAVCKQIGGKCGVYRYTWDGSGKPRFVNTGCVIDGLMKRLLGSYISVTPGGLMVVNDDKTETIRVYSHE